MTPRDPRDAIAGIASLVGAAGTGGVVVALEGALDALRSATGARVAAFFAGRPEEPAGMSLRAARGDGGAAAAVAAAIRADTAPLAAAALRLGQGIGGPGAAGVMQALGLPGGLLAPGVLDGRTEGAVGIVPGAADWGEAEVAAARGAAALMALAVRTDALVRGLGDRARALDRQARRLDGLTRMAQRLAEAPTAAAARRVAVSEARAIAPGATAVLLAPGPGGLVRELARDGTGAVAAEPAAVAAVAGGAGPWRRGGVVLVAVPAEGAVLALARDDAGPVPPEDVPLLEGLAAQASVALARGRLVDDLRREQDERRALAAAIVSAQEDERRRVAEDIHDGPVQGLAAVGLILDALVATLREQAPEAVEEASAAAAAAREAVRGLRRAISDLHPMALDELGLAAAVSALVERLEWRGVAVEVDVGAAGGLSRTQRTVAFRVLQEAVANVLRHAGATRVAIRARAAGGDVVLEVEDDGRGIAASARRAGRAAEGHLGLAAIEERAALAGGGLEVGPGEGGGTLLRLTLPAGEGAGQPGAPSPMRPSAAESAASSANRSSTTT